mgnify:CR=1 FL=1
MTDEMVARALDIVKSTDAVEFAKQKAMSIWRMQRPSCQRICRTRYGKRISWWLTSSVIVIFEE